MSGTTLRLALGVAVGDRPEALRAILRPGIAAAIWRRSLPPDLADWLDALPPAQLPRLRTLAAAPAAAAAVGAACAAAGLPAGPQRDRLAADAGLLARLLAAIAGAPILSVRLAAEPDEDCRGFHLARADLRLLCSYRGLGPRYGAVAVGAQPDPVAELPRGAAALFRGALSDRPDYPGIVHRGQGLAERDEPRLLLVLDATAGPWGRC